MTANAAARFAGGPDPGHTMSVSVSFRPEEGVLRPAVLIGIGSFGRRALQQIRCRLLDRIGELSQVPCFRFVYLDADPDTMKRAASGPLVPVPHVTRCQSASGMAAAISPAVCGRRAPAGHIVRNHRIATP